MLAAGIDRTAAVYIASIVDAHWRGSYDILVRPVGARLDLESTNGLVEPNFLGFAGTGGITPDQLEAIRTIPGVELAAPIGFVGYVRSQAPTIAIEIDTLPSQPTLYEVSLTTTTTDGLSSQLIQAGSGRVLLGPPLGDQPFSNWLTDLGGVSAAKSNDGTWDVGIGTRRVLPGLAVPILAVDPAAEEELLGSNANFLAPLSAIDAGGRTAGTFDPNSIPQDYSAAFSELSAIQQPNWQWSADRELPVIPLIVSSRQAADLITELAVSQIGHTLDAYPPDGLDGAVAEAGDGSTPVGSSITDAGLTLTPLRNPQLCVSWPGSTAACGLNSHFSTSSVDTRLVERPTYGPATDGPDAEAPSFSIVSLGAVAPDGDPSARNQGMSDVRTGVFPAYRQLVDVPLAKPAFPFSPHASVREPFVLAPVGTFDASGVPVPTDLLDYVPLGAYDPADTTFIAGPNGAPIPPTSMSYPLLPNGLVTTPPLAITDISGAQVLRGNSPIDAIRVRVAGVTDFGADSQARIEAVASAIEALGFDVDIMAGSSPQAVDIYVPDYHVDLSPPTDLGWVRQHWTTIGAAKRITEGFAASDLALLLLSVCAAAIWTLALGGLRLERRVRDAAILAAIGWSRSATVRWLSGESFVGAAAILLLGLLGFSIANGSLEALGVATIMAAVWLVGGILAALDATRRARPTAIGSMAGAGRPRWSAHVNSIGGYGLRAISVRGPWLIAIGIGLGAASASIALGAGLLAGLSARIGPTLLATFTGAAAALYQPLMLLAIASGSLAFVVAALRLNRRRRATEELVLSVSGWSRRRIGVLLWADLVPIAFVGAMLGLVATVLLGGPFEIGIVLAPVATSVVLALSVLIWGAAVCRDVTARPGDLS